MLHQRVTKTIQQGVADALSRRDENVDMNVRPTTTLSAINTNLPICIQEIYNSYERGKKFHDPIVQHVVSTMEPSLYKYTFEVLRRKENII